jgi:hypothetical protein
MDDRCCPDDLNYILLQINVICLLLALLGSTVVVKYQSSFGAEPPLAAESLIEK